MKSLKYSLFLSVASACMFSSSLVAAGTVVQTPVLVNPLTAPVTAVDNGKKQKLSPEEIEKRKADAAARKLAKQSQPVVASVEEHVMPNLFETPVAGGQVTTTAPIAPQLLPTTPVGVTSTLPATTLVATTPLQQHDVNAFATTPAVNSVPVALDATHTGTQVLTAPVGVTSTLPTTTAAISANVESQTVKEVVDAVPTKRAEDLVAALVANKLGTSDTQQNAVPLTGSDVTATVVPVEAVAPLAPVKKAKPTLTPEQALALASAKDAQATGRTLTPEETNALLAVEALKAEKAKRRAEAAANPANVPAAPTAKDKKAPKAGLSAESIAALKAAKSAQAQSAPLTQEQTEALVKAQAEIAAMKASKQQPVAAASAEDALPPVDLFAEPTPAPVLETPANALAEAELAKAKAEIETLKAQQSGVLTTTPTIVAEAIPAPVVPTATVTVLPTPDAEPKGVTLDAKLAMNGKGEVVITTTQTLNSPSSTPLTVERPAAVGGSTDTTAKKEEKAAGSTDAAAAKKEEKPAGGTDTAAAKKEEKAAAPAEIAAK
ncbi:MAG: hypothetical protein NT128_00335 [Proteobacteria bacterium]|nr:hypothetical protein [Pseudomonadota bacterium]